jgi:hypothetical protein
MNFEDTVGTTIIEFLSSCGDEDIQAGVGYLFQEPLSDNAKAFRDVLGATAIRAVAEWNLRYAVRSWSAHEIDR